jgi:hypothetical protein
MMLDVADLLTGKLGQMVDPEAHRAEITARAASWWQVPAASMPDDNAALAALCGYGRDVATWQRARAAGALADWIKCADGRLYHPDVAARARDTWAQRQAYRERALRGSEARWRDKDKGQDASSMPQASDKDSNKDAGKNAKVLRSEGIKVEGREVPSPSAQGAREKPGTKGFPLPTDWQPNAADRAFAIDLGIDPDAATVKFRDYWCDVPGAKGRKLSWSGTWRNRCRDLATRQQRPTPRPAATPRPNRFAVLRGLMPADGEIAGFAAMEEPL